MVMKLEEGAANKDGGMTPYEDQEMSVGSIQRCREVQ